MKKILIIEDEKILAEMYRHRFTQAGFEVISASESRKGLSLAKKERPNLILLDIILPKENGIFFLEQLKKEPAINSIPVVAFSNYDDPETKEEARKLGAKNYLIKTSYTPKEIIKEIRKYLK